MVAPATLLLAIGALAASVDAHSGCSGHEIGRRNLGGPEAKFVPRGRLLDARKASPVRRATVTDVASSKISLDPATECTYYSYAPASALTNNLPTIWATASLVAGDTEASTAFATLNSTLNSKFSSISPKGTKTGDFSGVTYDTATDPDCWWTRTHCTTPASDSGLSSDLTTVPEPNTWGFGFDDGPNCSHNALYDMLQNEQQQATMFFIGSNAIDWPLQALRALDDGHEICVHTWSHPYMTSLTNEQAFAELYYTRKVIKELLGVTPKCWRPPYGDVDNRIRAIAESLDLTNIIWEEDTDDWAVGTNGITEATIDANYQSFIDRAKNGSYSKAGPIVLNHELNNFTMGEMIKFYPQIKAAFANVVPIQAAYNITQPFVETNYTYSAFETYVAGTHNHTIGTETALRTNAYTDTAGMAAAYATASGPSGASGASGAAAASGATTASGSSSSSSSSSSKSSSGSSTVQFDVAAGVATLAGVAGMAALLL